MINILKVVKVINLILKVVKIANLTSKVVKVINLILKIVESDLKSGLKSSQKWPIYPCKWSKVANLPSKVVKSGQFNLESG